MKALAPTMAMLALLGSGHASAQVAPAAGEASAQGDVSVTIYNSGQALVQDVRQIAIAQGRSRIEFPDVSAMIRPETLSFASAGAGIVEQNFDFDLLTPEKLMEKAIGQTLTLIRTNPATGVETRERATVLSTEGGTVVRIGDRIEILREDGLPVRAVFDRVPPNLRARPTLSVTVDSDRAGTRPAQIRYLTQGLGWSADYVALYDEGAEKMDMQGWVTLTNNTGTTFRSANTLLVAGTPGRSFSGNRGMVRPGVQTSGREALGDYYLYPIAERTTIANAQTKQVSFLDVQGVVARKIYRREVGWQQEDSQFVNVSSEISFSTARAGGLGDALPAGTVRFYQKDKRGNPQFIGENSIPHSPMGSEMSLRTGEAFDILTQATVTKRETITSDEWEKSARYRIVRAGAVVESGEIEVPKKFYRTLMSYKVTNAKDKPVTVEIVQNGLDYGWWADTDFRVIRESIAGTQISNGRRKWQVPVPANGEVELTVEFQTRF